VQSRYGGLSLGKTCMGVEVFSEWGFYGSMAT